MSRKRSLPLDCEDLEIIKKIKGDSALSNIGFILEVKNIILLQSLRDQDLQDKVKEINNLPKTTVEGVQLSDIIYEINKAGTEGFDINKLTHEINLFICNNIQDLESRVFYLNVINAAANGKDRLNDIDDESTNPTIVDGELHEIENPELVPPVVVENPTGVGSSLKITIPSR